MTYHNIYYFSLLYNCTEPSTFTRMCNIRKNLRFYTPVFRRDLLWYGDVRPSLRVSVRCCIADLSACRPSPPEDLQHCRPPPGRSATLQTYPHFCKVPDSQFRIYRNKGFLIIIIDCTSLRLKWYQGEICNGGRFAMVFQYHCRSSGGKVCNGGRSAI